MKFNQSLVIALSVAVATLNVTAIRAAEIQGQQFNNQQSSSQIAIEGSTKTQFCSILLKC